MSIKQSLRKLVDAGVKRTVLNAANSHPAQSAIISKALKEPPPDTRYSLVDPLVMDVTATTIITIPVPLGASSVDVEVIQSYTLTDANGTIYTVTVNNYPPA